MKILCRFFCRSIALLLAYPASASSDNRGLTYDVLSGNTSMAFFEQSGTRTTRPGCATATRWAIDTSTPSGQAIFAQLLTANTLGKQNYVSGTGDCALWPDSESVAGIMWN